MLICERLSKASANDVRRLTGIWMIYARKLSGNSFETKQKRNKNQWEKMEDRIHFIQTERVMMQYAEKRDSQIIMSMWLCLLSNNWCNFEHHRTLYGVNDGIRFIPLTQITMYDVNMCVSLHWIHFSFVCRRWLIINCSMLRKNNNRNRS